MPPTLTVGCVVGETNNNLGGGTVEVLCVERAACPAEVQSMASCGGKGLDSVKRSHYGEINHHWPDFTSLTVTNCKNFFMMEGQLFLKDLW